MVVECTGLMVALSRRSTQRANTGGSGRAKSSEESRWRRAKGNLPEGGQQQAGDSRGHTRRQSAAIVQTAKEPVTPVYVTLSMHCSCY